MFKIIVLDPSFPAGEKKLENSFILDNYFNLYDDELETRYDDYLNLEIFEDCDYLHDRIFVNQTKTYSICFDVLRKWSNEVLNIDGPKHYFLVLMDNIQYNSCPNCIDNLLSIEMMNLNDRKIILPQELYEILDENVISKLPFWIQKMINWYNQEKISETELVNAINYLIPYLPEHSFQIKSSELEKTVLAFLKFETSSFDGGQPIVFSGKLTTEDGTRIPDSEILIKSDGPCPSDGIIAKGTTDKYGKFWIYTMPKKWDPTDNLIKIHAEFLGDNHRIVFLAHHHIG